MHHRQSHQHRALGLVLQPLQRTLQQAQLQLLYTESARGDGGGKVLSNANPAAPLACAYESFVVCPTTHVVSHAPAASFQHCTLPLAALVVGGFPELVQHRRHWTEAECAGAPPGAAPTEGANNEHECLVDDVACKVGFAFSCDADSLERAGLAAAVEGDVYDAPDAGAVRSALLRRLVPRVLDLVNRIVTRSGRQPVGASDLLVADASDPYDEHAFWTHKSQRLVYQIVVPSLHLANGADRRALHAELRRDEVLRPLVDEGAYAQPVGHVLVLGAQRIGGQPLLPVTSVPDECNGGVPLRFGGGGDAAVIDFRALEPEAVARHAWTLVDVKTSVRMFDDDGGAAGGPAATVSPEARDVLCVFDAWCRKRSMTCDASHFDVVESVGAASLTLTPAAAPLAEGQAPPCACPGRLAHDGGAPLRVWLEDGRHVMVQCCAAVPEGDAGELRLCNGRGVPTGATTSVTLRGGEHSHPTSARTCSVAYAGPLPETLFRVPVVLELPAIVDGDGRPRLGPLTDEAWRDATRTLRRSGRVSRGQVRSLILRQAMGSGKSYQAIHFLAALLRRANHMKQPRPRFIWLCPKVSLVERAFADLDAAMPGFWKTYDDPSVIWAVDSVVCCSQSCARIHNAESVQVLVVDEIRDALETAVQLNGGGGVSDVTDNLVRLVKAAKRSILMDAFADTSVMRLTERAGVLAAMCDTPSVQPFAGTHIKVVFPLSLSAKGCVNLYAEYGFAFVLEQVRAAPPGTPVHAAVLTMSDLHTLRFLATQAFGADTVAVMYGAQDSADKALTCERFAADGGEGAPAPLRLFITSPALVGGVSNTTCNVVVVLLRSTSSSGHGIMQSSRRARRADRVYFVAMEPGLMTKGSIQLASGERAVGPSEYVLSSEADAPAKEALERRRFAKPESALRLCAAKASFGVPSELAVSPDDAIYLKGSRKGVLKRVRFDPPAPLASPEQAGLQRTHAARVRSVIRHEQAASAANNSRGLTASETLGEARRARADDESLFEAELTDELGAERLNRQATLVRFILDANKAQGVHTAVEFLVLSAEEKAACAAKVQEAHLAQLKEAALEAIGVLRTVLTPASHAGGSEPAAPRAFADDAALEAYAVRLLAADEGPHTTGKRARDAAAAANTPPESSLEQMLSRMRARVQTQPLVAAGEDAPPSDHDDDADAEEAAPTNPTSGSLTPRQDALLKELYLAMLSFTRQGLEAVACDVETAATAFAAASGQDDSALRSAREALEAALSTWAKVTNRTSQMQFRAVNVLGSLLEASAEDAHDQFAAWAKKYVADASGDRCLCVLNLAVADELLRACGFRDGVLTPPEDEAKAPYDNPASHAHLANRASEAQRDAEVQRTARVRAIYQRAKGAEAPAHKLTEAVMRHVTELLQPLHQRMRVLDDGGGASSVLTIGAKSRSLRLAACPLLALRGRHTLDVNAKWLQFWQRVNEERRGTAGDAQ